VPNIRTVEYKAWDAMKQRCYNPNNCSYKWYGQEGVIVCKRWLGKNGFSNFIADMKCRPTKNHSLDRVNRNKMYCPSNCKWSTKQEQVINRRITKLNWSQVNSIRQAKHLSQKELALLYGVHQCVISRIKSNLRWAIKGGTIRHS
jgi:hypothetical protein